MATSDPVRVTQKPPGPWQILTATERGAAHEAAGLPNQDAVAACDLGRDGVTVAVADGHGHSRHFRSQRGAQLAVTTACQAVSHHTSWLATLAEQDEISRQIREILVPAIVGRWRESVRADISTRPLTPAEEPSRWPGDDPMIAYGTTLLVAVAWRQWLLLAQIGDGDIVGVRPDGRALLPVPGDPLLDGRHTTSLCSPWAEGSFRAATVDTGHTPLRGVLLATDGYGNAQAAEAWEQAVSADLATLIAGHSPRWLAGQLPVWARRCASADGSADDTTLALLIPPADQALAEADTLPGEPVD